jgi:hypothetical protein
LPGTVLRNIPVGTTLDLDVVLQPARSGTYELRIYRNANTLVARRIVPRTANQLTSYNFTTVFPEDTHGYWLYVRETRSNLDIIYSTPVIVTSRP